MRICRWYQIYYGKRWENRYTINTDVVFNNCILNTVSRVFIWYCYFLLENRSCRQPSNYVTIFRIIIWSIAFLRGQIITFSTLVKNPAKLLNYEFHYLLLHYVAVLSRSAEGEQCVSKNYSKQKKTKWNLALPITTNW